MRRTWGRRLRGISAHFGRKADFERLEYRLALSYGPLPVAPEIASIGPSRDIAPGVDVPDAPHESRFYGYPETDVHDHDAFIAPPSMSGSAMPGAPLHSSGDYRISPPQIQITPVQIAPVQIALAPTYDRFEPIVLVVIVDRNFFSLVQSGPARSDAPIHMETNLVLDAPPVDANAAHHDRLATANVSITARAELPAPATAGISLSAIGARGSVEAGSASGSAAALNYAPALPQVSTSPMMARGDVAGIPLPGMLAPPVDRDTAQAPDTAAALPGTLGPNLDMHAGGPQVNADPLGSTTSWMLSSESDASDSQLRDAGLGDARAALMSGLGLNVEAIDQTLQTAMDEVERLGGELVTWLDEVALPPWAVTTITVAAIGAGSTYFWRGGNRRSLEEEMEEESSSWLFSRLHSPAGQV